MTRPRKVKCESHCSAHPILCVLVVFTRYNMGHGILLFTLLSLAALALADSDDKFFKKYAMMKIYESCFGPDVVKQVRQEMKEAYAKCSSPPSVGEGLIQRVPSLILANLPQGFESDPATQTITKPTDGAVPENVPQILSHKQMFDNMLKQRPFQAPAVPNPYPMPNQFRPYPQPYYQSPLNPMYYPPGVQYNPYTYQQQQYQQGFYQPPYFQQNNRISRDINIRDRFEMLSHMSNPGRTRNITCVVQELGYLDHNMEPNYEQIAQRINNLPVSSQLKGDIQDGVHFCQKFSQCVPEIERNAPLSQELIKPMFFFRCYKHKKLEACIMKDIRERFAADDDLDTDTDFRSLSRAARSVREETISDPRLEALDEMSVYFYDYLSGGTGLDFDLYL